MKHYFLYNPIAGNGKCAEILNTLPESKYQNMVCCDLTEIDDIESFVSNIDSEDKIIICGGDGTLNTFINAVNTDKSDNEIYYYPAGSGNDFVNDLGLDNISQPIKINDYIENLPVATINGKERKFFNGIGYGIDGYVCAEGDRLRRLKGKPINYTLVALKGLIYAFKPVNATVTVDGKEFKYKKVWLVPTMKGRLFGGGMKIAPMQDRFNQDGSLSILIAHDLSKPKITALFLTIFKGEHIKFKKNVTVHTGKEVKVVFDRPCPMQIDGEPIDNIIEYSVTAKSFITK